MSVRKKDNPELYKRIEEQNLLRQYDLLSNCIEIGVEKGIESFDKYTLWALKIRRTLSGRAYLRRQAHTAELQGRTQPHGQDVLSNS